MSGTNSRKFSLGVDKVTNIIVVSAEGEDFLQVICEMVEQLDQAAKPSGTVQVLKMDTHEKNKSMEKALKAILESSRGKQAPNQQQQGQPGQPGQGGQQANQGGQAAPE